MRVSRAENWAFHSAWLYNFQFFGFGGKSCGRSAEQSAYGTSDDNNQVPACSTM
ncbi:hypothetical protein IMZ48_02265 [Candidatus Bathyarchaeota archaeon]|nr:hypothetical protein [Candidatus Bathyarchaeota archaeon]